MSNLAKTNEFLTKEETRLAIRKVLPTSVELNKFLEIAWSTVRGNSHLHDCTPASIVSSVKEAAQLGLTIDGVLGEAYLVPYGKTAQLQPGYRGLRKLALQSEAIYRIEAHVVYACDLEDPYTFQVERRDTGTTYVHRPNPFGKKGSEDIVGAYAIAYYTDSMDRNPQIEVMSREQIEFARNCSKGKNSGPWRQHYAEMARKTVIRRLCKHLPLEEDVLRFVNHSELVDIGEASVRDVEDTGPTAEDLIIEAVEVS